MLHESNRMQRAKDQIGEGVYLALWQEKQERRLGFDSGFGLLDLILNEKSIRQFPLGTSIQQRLREIDGYTQRDATVAASVIQWLGTKHGALFIQEAERRIKKADKAAMWKHHQKNNLGLAVIDPDSMPIPF